MQKDRFTKISSDYAELFYEVYSVQGLDYKKFEESVFENVKKLVPNFRNVPILDIGIGDGETSIPFLEAGCRRLVGIDLNPEMIKSAKKRLKRFGDSIKLFQMDATKMSFKTSEFPIIISAMAIHNISKKDRIGLWKELIRLSPDIFVNAEKITDPDPMKYKTYYDNEIRAIKKVYGDKYGLHEVEKEWIKHYEDDEKERLLMSEIENNIGKEYNIEIVFEMGLGKTVVAIKK